MKLVILESPYAGEVEDNLSYARACMRDSLLRGEAPIASHLLYTQKGILDDLNVDERNMGIEAGLSWMDVSEATVVYIDKGVSSGMKYGIGAALASGKPVLFRSIYEKSSHE